MAVRRIRASGVRAQFTRGQVTGSMQKLRGDGMFERRHYDKIATAFLIARADAAGSASEQRGIMLAENEIMLMLAQDNANFDEARYAAASGRNAQ